MSKIRVTSITTGCTEILKVVGNESTTIFNRFHIKVYPSRYDYNTDEGYWIDINKIERFKVSKIPEVTLDHESLLKISEHIQKNDEIIRKQVGPAQLEILIFQAIRDITGVDFIEYEAKWD